MADQTGVQYDSHTHSWKEIYGPTEDTSTSPVQPQNSPSTPTASGGGAEGDSAKKFRDREFNLEGTAAIMPSPHTEARTVVEFMGLGAQFSGRYYVKTVRSTWSKDGGYTQELEVKRNGFAGFTTPIPTPAETSPNRQPRAQVPVENDATYYTVKQGDTLWSIAKQFYGDGKEYTKISTANNLANPSDIAAGQELLIP